MRYNHASIMKEVVIHTGTDNKRSLKKLHDYWRKKPNTGSLFLRQVSPGHFTLIELPSEEQVPWNPESMALELEELLFLAEWESGLSFD